MKKKLLFNKIIWAVIFIIVFLGAWFTGERILYLTTIVLFVLPVSSFLLSFLLVFGIKVSCKQPKKILKNMVGVLEINLHNRTFMPMRNVEILLVSDEDAIFILKNKAVNINPFSRKKTKITFEIEYRGFYHFGLEAIQITDLTGLFRFRRKFSGRSILSLPLVPEISNFPIAANMTALASNFDMRGEDYSTISDVRQYVPTDSIKRVHWKLTAKRSEWMVKNFQSNAQKLVTIILDTADIDLPAKLKYEREDKIIESTLGLAKFCLYNGIPVNLIAKAALPLSEGSVAGVSPAERRNLGQSPININAASFVQFEIIYQALCNLKFSGESNCHNILNGGISGISSTGGNAAVVILTSRLTASFYESVVKATKSGHHITVLFFAATDDEEGRKIFDALNTDGVNCLGY